jgi:hypothetical protein
MRNSTSKPDGVWIIELLTLFAFFLLGWLDLLVVGALARFSVYGLSFTEGLMALSPLVLTLLTLTAFGKLRSKVADRRSWLFLVAFWIAFFVYFVWYDIPLFADVGHTYYGGPWQLTESWQYSEVIALILPLIYSVVCILYFLTGRVRRYFGFDVKQV